MSKAYRRPVSFIIGLLKDEPTPIERIKIAMEEAGYSESTVPHQIRILKRWPGCLVKNEEIGVTVQKNPEFIEDTAVPVRSQKKDGVAKSKPKAKAKKVKSVKAKPKAKSEKAKAKPKAKSEKAKAKPKAKKTSESGSEEGSTFRPAPKPSQE